MLSGKLRHIQAVIAERVRAWDVIREILLLRLDVGLRLLVRVFVREVEVFDIPSVVVDIGYINDVLLLLPVLTRPGGEHVLLHLELEVQVGFLQIDLLLLLIKLRVQDVLLLDVGVRPVYVHGGARLAVGDERLRRDQRRRFKIKFNVLLGLLIKRLLQRLD